MLRMTVRLTDGTLWAATTINTVDDQHIELFINGNTQRIHVSHVAEIVVRLPTVISTKDEVAAEDAPAGAPETEVKTS